MPTKALVHSSSLRREGDDPQEHFTESAATRDALVEKLNSVNLAMLADREMVTVVDGRARFVDTRDVEVEPSHGASDTAERMRINAETVVINTGAVSALPNTPRVDGPRIYDSTTLQHIRPFPKRLAIVGAGPIALEFAAMFRGFGSDVTITARGERQT